VSLTISLTVEQVEQRLSLLGIRCSFTDAERLAPPPAHAVNIDGRTFSFPTPQDNSSLTLANIKHFVGVDPARQPCFFDHPWPRDEPFMNTLCPSGWHLLYMDVLPESVGQPPDYARSLAPGRLELPSAVEIILMLFLHYVGTGEQLLSRKHTWCADQASLGRVVTVGAFGRNGVFLSAHSPGFASRGLGICPKAMTFSQPAG